MTRLIKSVKDIQAVLEKSPRSIALVPTMGSLHAGHISLINAAKNQCKTTVVYIFVNPLQFGPNEDLDKYPRDLNNDLKICEENNVDFVFAPEVNEIYPNGESKTISPPAKLISGLCGKTRKNHFSGVATVIKRFFDIIQPNFAFFGEKDLQQLYVIRWLMKEFNLPTVINSCSTIREPSGLACSSRNKYLTEEQKEIASNLYKSLVLAKNNIRSGFFTLGKAVLESLIFLSAFPEIKVEYFEVRGKENLEPVSDELISGIYFLVAATEMIFSCFST